MDARQAPHNGQGCQIFALTLRGIKNTSNRFKTTIYDWQAIIKPVLMFNALPFFKRAAICFSVAPEHIDLVSEKS